MTGKVTILRKTPRPVWWVGGLLLVYTLLGFLFVPWIAERQISNLLEQRLSLATEIESLYFNPFTMYAEVDALTVTDEDGLPLVGLNNLQANFQPLRLFLLKLQFADIAVTGLDFHFNRESESANTVVNLAERWSATAEPAEPQETAENEQAGGPVPLAIDSITLANINLHVRDEVPDVPFETILSLVTAQLNNLSTLEDDEGSNTLTLQFEEDAQLQLSGQLQLNPPQFNGTLALQDFGLAVISRYLQDTIPVTIESGRLDTSLVYNIDMSGQSPTLAIEDFSLAVSELAGIQSGQQSPIVTANLLQIEDGRLRYPGNQLELGSVSLGQVELAVTRNNDGVINLQEIAAALQGSEATESTTTTTSSTTDPTEPWTISLGLFELAGNRITFVDQSLESPANLGVSLDVTLENLDNQPDSVFPVSANLAMDSGGELQLDGSLVVLPALEVESSVSLNSLDLTVLQPYISEFAFIQLDSGVVELETEIQSNPTELFSYRGDLRLLDIAASDQQLQESLLTMDAMIVDSVNFSLAANSLDISEIIFESMFARVVINEDGSTNLGRSIKTATTAGDDTTTTADTDNDGDAEASPLEVTVGRIQVNNGASNFTDRNLPINFDTNVRELAGSAEGFATNSTQPMAFALEGNVDEFGLLQLTSTINPFDVTGQSQIDLQFRNLDMPAMTPYTIKFAGREIADGNVDVDLSYTIEAGELAANNRVVLRDLQLGERVEQPDAMDLPLDLAIALLKDGNGVIDLEVPVNGNVNDPEFDLGPVIRRAIVNVLTSIVAAPFRLLGNLVGGDSDGLDRIKFLPGRSDIAPPEQQVLQQLHQALLQRPQLVLEIPLMTAEADRLALQTDALNTRIEARLAQQADDSDQSLTERRLTIVESLFQEASLLPSLAELRAVNSIESTQVNPLTGQPSGIPQLDVPAHVEDLRERLIAAESISDEDLAGLAQARAGSVEDFLINLGDLTALRLLTTESQPGEQDDDGWLVLEFGLSTGN